jgi:hypothetical protein
LVILAARRSLSDVVLATGAGSTDLIEPTVTLITTTAKAANRKMPQPTITARLRS